MEFSTIHSKQKIAYTFSLILTTIQLQAALKHNPSY